MSIHSVILKYQKGEYFFTDMKISINNYNRPIHILNLDIHKAITQWLEKYLEIDKRLYSVYENNEELVASDKIQDCFSYLLEEMVFSSVKELKEVFVKETGYILPDFVLKRR